MNKKPFDDMILTGSAADGLVEDVYAVLDGPLQSVLRNSGIDVSGIIRFHALASRCRRARESSGASIKDVAAILRVPQYRIRDIEQNRPARAVEEVVVKYVRHLGLEEWYATWKKAETE